MRKFCGSLLLLALLIPTLASAQTVPIFSSQRLGGFVDAGVRTYDATTQEVYGTASSFSLGGGLAYSTGREISLGLGLDWDIANDACRAEVGPRWLIVGDGAGRYTQVALGGNGIKYFGDGTSYIAEDFSYNVGIYLSYNLSGNVQQPIRWYLAGNAEHDPNNSNTSLRLGIRAVAFPTKQP